MRGSSSPICFQYGAALRPMLAPFFFACFLLALPAAPGFAQSTFGEILGTVHDSSGAVVEGAQVTLTNTGTTATRTLVTDASGSYAFKNIDVATYTLTFTAPGFEKESLPAIGLTARETRRMDATLKAGAESQTVVVTEDTSPVITTDVSNLAETKAGADFPEPRSRAVGHYEQHKRSDYEERAHDDMQYDRKLAQRIDLHEPRALVLAAGIEIQGDALELHAQYAH